jgi:hypothetical protein
VIAHSLIFNVKNVKESNFKNESIRIKLEIMQLSKKNVTSGKISNLAPKTANVSQKALIFVEEY